MWTASTPTPQTKGPGHLPGVSPSPRHHLLCWTQPSTSTASWDCGRCRTTLRHRRPPASRWFRSPRARSRGHSAGSCRRKPHGDTRELQAGRRPLPPVRAPSANLIRARENPERLRHFAVARDLRVKLRVPVVQVEVATYLIEECDLAGTQLAALALDHLRGPTNTFRHSWTTSFLRSAILARNRPFVTLVSCQPTSREIP
jgi:hypothetical protein